MHVKRDLQVAQKLENWYIKSVINRSKLIYVFFCHLFKGFLLVTSLKLIMFLSYRFPI